MPSRAAVFTCGVEPALCTGSMGKWSKSVPQGTKAHGSSTDAFHCAVQALLKQGYTRGDDARSFTAPDQSHTRVLTKPSRFGHKMRSGKEGGRNMPSKLNRDCRGGFIGSH